MMVRAVVLVVAGLVSSACLAGGDWLWDFTKGVPADGRLRACAAVEPGGLRPTQIADMSKGAGFELGRQFAYPQAFRFDAELTLRALAWTDENAKTSGAYARENIVWDDMAVTYPPKRKNRGLQVTLKAWAADSWQPLAYFGNGETTCCADGPRFNPTANGGNVRISFYYDSKGNVFWRVADIRHQSRLRAGGAVVVPERARPVIGDRVCSLYHPVDGFVRSVRIREIEVQPLGSQIVSRRRAFVRGEPKAGVEVSVLNVAGTGLTDVALTAEQMDVDGKSVVQRHSLTLGTLASKEIVTRPVPVETLVRPGWADLVVTLTGKTPDGKPVRTVDRHRIGIGPKSGDALPTLMWHFSGGPGLLAPFGFTHGYASIGFVSPRTPESDTSRTDQALDEALVAGVRLASTVRVPLPEGGEPGRYLRRPRTGLPSDREKGAPEVGDPAVVALAVKTAEDNVAAFGSHPALAGVLPVSEMRDKTYPSFNTEHLRYKAETGREVPAEVERKVFNLKAAEKRFPDGVVPEDDPILAYYRWFWSGGDGWPGYSGAVADTYRKGIARSDFFSFWDPAVRCPPRWGSGGTVDMLNQWVYAVPEPMAVAGPVEEEFAMAAGRPGQKVGIMTQLICYRRQLAPKGVEVTPTPDWVKRLPEAEFPTIPPDTLQEATWSMLAKPVQAIMYHGWGTIYDTGEDRRYCYTNPEGGKRLAHLLKNVVAPLGPALKRIGREVQQVAVFESFTTAAMGGPCPWGWNSPAITFLQRARLDPRVVYEQTLERDGFGGIKVLYAPQCRFLTSKTIGLIRDFQRKGGILIADADLVGALKADVTVPVMSFRPPESDHTAEVEQNEAKLEGDVKQRLKTMRAKASMLEAAGALRSALEGRYAPKTDSSSPEIVVYSRQAGAADYVFAINDRRTFGDYVGMWGMTMEKGLPFAGDVLKDDPKRTVAAVYELSRGGAVKWSREGARIRVPLAWETNDGRLLLFSPAKIAKLAVSAPAEVAAAGRVKARLSVCDEKGRPVRAVLPVEIRLYDAAGREIDGVGYAAAVNGVAEAEFQLNRNDAAGDYRLVCRDRASGLVAERRIRRK